MKPNRNTKADSGSASKGIAKPMLAEVQKAFSGAEYEIGGKKATEYRFFKSIADEIKGKKKKQVFYWTDEKVMLLLECLDIKITAETLAEFKSHFR